MISIPPVEAPYLSAPPAPIPISNPPSVEAANTCTCSLSPKSTLGMSDKNNE